MSTKLYDGLMFEGTYVQLAEKLKDASEKVRDEISEFISEEVSEKLCIVYDAMNAGASVEKIQKMITPLSALMTDDLIRMEEGTTFSLIAYRLSKELAEDFKSTIVTYPFKDNKILAYPFLKGTSFDFEDVEGFREYGYWNNTDRPDELTEEEWAQREKDWDSVVGPRFIDGGFSYLLFDEGAFIVPKHFKFIPQSLEKRVKLLNVYANIQVKEDELLELPEKILETELKVKVEN